MNIFKLYFLKDFNEYLQLSRSIDIMISCVLCAVFQIVLKQVLPFFRMKITNRITEGLLVMQNKIVGPCSRLLYFKLIKIIIFLSQEVFYNVLWRSFMIERKHKWIGRLNWQPWLQIKSSTIQVKRFSDCIYSWKLTINSFRQCNGTL